MKTVSYCKHLRKQYVGDKAPSQRPENGNDYVFTCGLHYAKGTVRRNPYLAMERFCAGCEHFKSHLTK